MTNNLHIVLDSIASPKSLDSQLDSDVTESMFLLLMRCILTISNIGCHVFFKALQPVFQMIIVVAVFLLLIHQAPLWLEIHGRATVMLAASFPLQDKLGHLSFERMMVPS